MHLCSPIPSEMLAFELNADNTPDNKRKSPSSLARRTRCPWFPTRMSNLDSSDQRTLFHFETVHEWQSFSWHLQMAPRVVFTDSGFWKYSWAHLVMSMTESCRWVMQCRLRAWSPRASNKGLQPCPLGTETSILQTDTSDSIQNELNFATS